MRKTIILLTSIIISCGVVSETSTTSSGIDPRTEDDGGIYIMDAASDAFDATNDTTEDVYIDASNDVLEEETSVDAGMDCHIE